MSKRTSALWADVEWEDSRLSRQGWIPASEVLARRHRRVRMRSAGYVLADDKTGVVLVSSIGPRGSERVAGAVIIPRSAVRKVRRLR